MALSLLVFTLYDPFSGHSKLLTNPLLMITMKTSMQVMQELGLIGLRIQRMPSEPNLEFGIPSQYSYMTVRSHPLQCCTQIIWEYNEKNVLIENGTEFQRGCVD